MSSIDWISEESRKNYESLIENARTLVDEEGEAHHIIPKAFFKLENVPVDNSIGNLCTLSVYKHILAHYYLLVGTRGEQRRRMLRAFSIMIIPSRMRKLSEDQKLSLKALPRFEELIEESLYEFPRYARSPKACQHRKDSLKGKRSGYGTVTLLRKNNTKVMLFLDELVRIDMIKEELRFVQDKIFGYKNTLKIQKLYADILNLLLNNNNYVSREDIRNMNLKKIRKQESYKPISTQRITDGDIYLSIRSDWPIPMGWYLYKPERRKSTQIPPNLKGRVYITDGQHLKRIKSDEEIPEGWTKGTGKILSKSPSFTGKDTIWITNGLENRRISKNSVIPDDWMIGMTIKHHH